MTLRITTTDFRRGVRRYVEGEPPLALVITRHGRDHLVLLSHVEYARLKAFDRHRTWLEAETERTVAAIESGEELIPHPEVMPRLQVHQKDRRKR